MLTTTPHASEGRRGLWTRARSRKRSTWASRASIGTPTSWAPSGSAGACGSTSTGRCRTGHLTRATAAQARGRNRRDPQQRRQHQAPTKRHHRPPTAGYCRSGAGMGRDEATCVTAVGSVFGVVDRVAEVAERRVERGQHAPKGVPADIELSALHPARRGCRRCRRALLLPLASCPPVPGACAALGRG